MGGGVKRGETGKEEDIGAQFGDRGTRARVEACTSGWEVWEEPRG